MVSISHKIVGGRFRTTHWPLIQSAADADAPSQQKALEKLLAQYLPALKDFLMARFKFDGDYADDVLQTFVLEKVIKKKLIAQAKRERGRFRTFLLNSICNFAISEIRRTEAQKRIPRHILVALDHDEADALQIIDTKTTEQFDLAFTRQVLSGAISRMREHCEKIKRPEIWEVFEARILKPAMDDDEPLAYDKLVGRFGFRSPDHASNILISGKRMFTRILKSVVGQYSLTSREVEEELRYLKALLEKA